MNKSLRVFPCTCSDSKSKNNNAINTERKFAGLMGKNSRRSEWKKLASCTVFRFPIFTCHTFFMYTYLYPSPLKRVAAIENPAMVMVNDRKKSLSTRSTAATNEIETHFLCFHVSKMNAVFALYFYLIRTVKKKGYSFFQCWTYFYRIKREKRR